MRVARMIKRHLEGIVTATGKGEQRATPLGPVPLITGAYRTASVRSVRSHFAHHDRYSSMAREGCQPPRSNPSSQRLSKPSFAHREARSIIVIY